MKRPLVLLTACAALLACQAGTATAIGFHSEIGSTTLTGTQIGEDQFQFDFGLVECEEATYFGAQAGTTSTAASVRPVYELCSGGIWTAVAHVNNCDYELHLTSELSSTTFLGDIALVCPAGKEVSFTYLGLGTTKCTVHIPPQSHSETIVAHNEGSGTGRDVKFLVELKNVVYRETAGSGIGACATSGLKANGTILAQLTLKGEEGNTQRGFWVA
jgi:hypothetical protein